MKALEYRFVTQWRLQAGAERVWAALFDLPGWPTWWRGVAEVRVEKMSAADQGIGSRVQCCWRGRIAYPMTFVVTLEAIEPSRMIRVKVDGDLRGTGMWELAETDAETTVTFTWEVATTKAWMNWLGQRALGRKMFESSHHQIMAWGEQGLGNYLRAG